MKAVKCNLPEYPQKTDMWRELQRDCRPIVIYGMGNGADKLIDRFDKLGIKYADIFASDGFVRGHSFRGMRVKSFSEIKAEYSDFVIVLSFASNRPEVLELLEGIDREYDMYVPDMPVSGEEYFDMELYNAHYGEIRRAYEALADEDSRSVFANIISYKLSGRMSYLMDAYSTKDELYSELGRTEIHEYIDVGAYNGDTLREAIQYFPSLKSAAAIEPDPKTFKRLLRYTESEDRISIRAINAAAGADIGKTGFLSGGNRNSSVASTASYQHKDEVIDMITVDSLGMQPDLIKYDVEGAEEDALIGSDATIRAHRPTLLVSLYHRSRDIFYLVNLLREKYPFYEMRLLRLRCLPAWEIDLLLFST